MNVVIAAMSAPVRMNGVSRHGESLVRALLTTDSISQVHFLAGEWQREMFVSALACCDARLHSHWISLPDSNVSRLFWYYRELPGIAAQLAADIVHLTFPAPFARDAFHCPTVLSLHDLYPFEAPRNFGFLRSALARRTSEQCIRRVDAIACVSSSTRRAFNEVFPSLAEKTVVIPNVVGLNATASPQGGPEGLKGRDFMLCVAQHRSNKNIPLAIRVFEALLLEKTLSFESRLAIVGIPGPETARIEEEIQRAKLSCKVLLYSGLTDAEMRWCFESCEALLAPSSTEGFGLPVVEGMLAGTRVVCSDIPAFREVGGESCHYVPWTQDPVAEYTRAVRQALAGPRPRSVKLLRFAASSVGAQYVRLYSDLAASPVAGYGSDRQFALLQHPSAASRSK